MRHISLLIVLLMLLAACGSKGQLYLPQKSAQENPQKQEQERDKQ